MLGDKSFNDFADGSVRAAAAGNLYPTVRDMMLRSHPWNCARARLSLAPDVTAPAFDWSYRFLKPADWMRTLSVGESGYEVDYIEEGRYILSNDNPCLLRYVFQNIVEASWDTMLVYGMTLAMKTAMAYTITRDMGVANAAQGELVGFLQRARAIDGQDVPPETVGDFRLLASRGASGFNWKS